MKYLNKIKNPWRFSVVLFLSVFALLTGIIIALLIKFPIKLSSQEMNLNNTWEAKFFVFWPESLLKRELSERKKIKRYSRIEIQRRIDKQLSLMTFINSPLYDLWLDKNAEFITNNTTRISNDASFFWPVLSKSFDVSYDNILQIKNSHFVVFPDFNKATLKKGRYLGSGEAIRSSIPVFNAKKYLIFEVLPLAPGYTKIALGQYVWTKTFTENDIHKTLKFFIPINDSLAQTYKISNISSSFYVLDLKIVSILPNGRETIYIPQQNSLWTPKPANVSSETADPLTEISNPSVTFDRDTTLAKGYNTLVISIDDFNSDLFKNPKDFAKIMPDMYEFYLTSLHISNFNMVEENDKFNIPLVYKKYGYKTVLFSNASTVSLQDNITSFKDFEKISRSWLIKSDSPLQENITLKNTNKRELDGLNAVFKPNAEEQIPGIENSDFKKISDYLKLLSENPVHVENLPFDEHFLLAEKNYPLNLVDHFQKWSGSQMQNRLYIDLILSVDKTKSITSLQDFLFVLTKKPNLSWEKIHRNIKNRVVNREFKQITEALRVRNITHRTIIVVLLKNSAKPENSNALVFIPGLKPKTQNYSGEIALRDLMFYSMSVAGIPLESAINFAQTYRNPETNQIVELVSAKNSENIPDTTYTLVISPSFNNCSSFTWQATNATIRNIKANFPFYQVTNTNSLEFFPCAFGEKVLEIEWNQKALPNKLITNQKNINSNHLYGYFTPPVKNTKPIELYYGKSLSSRKDFPLNFHHTPEQINSLFLVDKKEIDQLRAFAISSFSTMRLDSKIAQNTQAALLISTDTK